MGCKSGQRGRGTWVNLGGAALATLQELVELKMMISPKKTSLPKLIIKILFLFFGVFGKIRHVCHR